MALNVLLISQISGYVISSILSLCVIIPMSLHQEEFRYVFAHYKHFHSTPRTSATRYNPLKSPQPVKHVTLPRKIMFCNVFRGHCLLFSTGTWTESGQFNVSWASQAYCNYTIFVGVMLFVISAIQIYRMSIFVYRGLDRYAFWLLSCS